MKEDEKGNSHGQWEEREQSHCGEIAPTRLRIGGKWCSRKTETELQAGNSKSRSRSPRYEYQG